MPPGLPSWRRPRRWNARWPIAGSHADTLRGTVRVSSILCVIEHLIAPRLAQFAERHPNLVLELIGTNEVSSLARREVDIAIRLHHPERGKLMARRLGRIRFVLAGRMDRRLAGYIAYERDLDELPEIATIMSHFGGKPTIVRIATLSGARAAMETGVGAVMLPEWMVDSERGIGVIDPSVTAGRGGNVGPAQTQ
ncbi:MAG: LysR substrate-binding domain-containing protein [Breoghania sp.]|nr:LysR substrate-binding domain-containing protein [Breoghania sp.]MDJ0930969.1 LysR substrate-binding domain-containing protein [Breoghania sp.]